MEGPTLERLLSEQHWLHALATRLVRDEAERDDLVQEAWIVALQEGHGILDPRAWLRGVLRNRWRERRRAEARRQTRERANASTPVPDPRELAQAAELQQILASAVLALEEPYRSSVLLHYWGGLAPTTIASREGIPAATVRSRLLRARELLRARLAREKHGQPSWALAFLPLARVPRSSAMPIAGTLVACAGVALLALRLWPGSGAVASGSNGTSASAAARLASPAPTSVPRAGARQAFEPSLPATLQEPALDLRVLDPRRQPVRAARVTWSSSRSAGEGTTDADGRCAIPGQAWGPEPGVLVRVESAGLFHAEQRLGFAQSHTLVLEDEVALEGRVLEAEDGSPWIGARVWPFHGHCDLPPLTTDAEGRFRLDSAPIGRTFGVAVWSPGRPYLYRLAKLEGPPDGPFVVWGHTEARVEGTLRDALTGTVLTDARVWLDESLSEPATGGRFALASERSEWYFRFAAPGYVPLAVHGVGPRRDLDVRLLPAGRVRGRVLSPAGSPLAGALVRVQPDEGCISVGDFLASLGPDAVLPGLLPTADLMPQTLEGRSDAEGRFELTGLLPEARSLLIVAHEATLQRAIELERGPSAGGEFQRDVVLGPGSTLRGRVLEGDRPLRWELRLDEPGVADRRVWSGVDGTFEFTGLPESGAHLRTEPSGVSRLEVGPGDALEVEVQLDLVRVTGVVVGPEGPLANEGVRFESEGRDSQHFSAWARSDAQGAFSFELERELLPGRLSCNETRLRVTDESSAPLELRVSSHPSPRGTLWLRAVDARSGAPILDGNLIERGTEWPELGEDVLTTPALDGRIPLALAPGRHELAFGLPWEGYPFVVLEPFELAVGERRELHVTLERAPRVRFVFTGDERPFDLAFRLERTLDGREGLPFEVHREVRVEGGETERRLPPGVYTLSAEGMHFDPAQVTLLPGDPGPIAVRSARVH